MMENKWFDAICKRSPMKAEVEHEEFSELLLWPLVGNALASIAVSLHEIAMHVAHPMVSVEGPTHPEVVLPSEGVDVREVVCGVCMGSGISRYETGAAPDCFCPQCQGARIVKVAVGMQVHHTLDGKVVGVSRAKD